MYIRGGDAADIAQIWKDLADFPAAAADDALLHCLRELVRIIGADNGFWVAAVRENDVPTGDALRGWQPRGMVYLHFDADREHRVDALMGEMRLNRIDPMTAANVAQAGKTRSFLREELVDDATWRGSWLYNEVLHPLHVEDRLIGSHAVDKQHESYLSFDRGPADAPFGDRERDLLAFFLAGASRFHRELLGTRGLLPNTVALSRREREVLRLLLTDLREKEIAAMLGLGARTTHQHVVAILRKFGVHGRVGLMAQWLGRRD